MRSFSTKTLETIYNHGILPSVLYAILIWGSSSSISEVNKTHIRPARYVKKVKRTLMTKTFCKLQFEYQLTSTTREQWLVKHLKFTKDVWLLCCQN